MRYADPDRCPDCRQPFGTPVPAACPHCGLPLQGEAAATLFTTLLQADRQLADLRIGAQTSRLGGSEVSRRADSAPIPRTLEPTRSSFGA